MALEEGTLQEIFVLVRGGFEDRESIIELLCEEMHEPGELDPNDVEAAVDEAFATLEAEKSTWPATTDCDKLDAVFEALNNRNIVALQNAGYTQSDGYDDISEVFHEHPDRQSVVGYCFYHGQDLEHALDGGGLYLAFGPIDGRKETTDGPLIGAIVREELERQGFEVEWNGTFEQRIYVRELDWKRR